MHFFQWLLLILLFLILVEMAFLIFYGRRAKYLGKETKPLTVHRDGKTIAIFGDSTTAGTGASDENLSLSGRLATAFPNASVKNYARVGIGTKELAYVLREHADTKADVVIVHIGGIDVMTFRSFRHLEKRLVYIFNVSKKISDGKVMVCPPPNLGNIAYFHFPLSIYIEWRTRKLHSIFTRIAKREGIAYVNLFQEKAEDPFYHSPHLFLASDRIHPNDAGYGLWYDKWHETLLKEQFDKLLQ